MSEARKLGKNLKRIRMQKGISQGGIARALRADKGFISNIENGKTNPTLSTIAKVASVLGVSASVLLQ
jgi:transcriptional regulator with XRE-family HTH domain